MKLNVYNENDVYFKLEDYEGVVKLLACNSKGHRRACICLIGEKLKLVGAVNDSLGFKLNYRGEVDYV